VTDIPIGTVGKIVAGSDAGWYVRVDDTGDTGGYYIFMGPKPDMCGSFDGWALNLEEVEGYFRGNPWEVEWLDPDTQALQ
jgi:hypothetical protein